MSEKDIVLNPYSPEMRFKEYLWIPMIILAIAGVFLLTTSVYGFFFKEQQPDFIKNFNDSIGNWIYWTFVGGVVFIVAGVWYIVDIYRSRKELLEYLEGDSKAKFVKNLRRIEELAHKLGSKYIEMVEEKKRKWRIKH